MKDNLGRSIYLHDAIRKQVIPNGYEIQASDVGDLLSLGWGRILPVNVGCRVYVRDGLFSMENTDQRNKRKGVK